jgi:hypothetical protein
MPTPSLQLLRQTLAGHIVVLLLLAGHSSKVEAFTWSNLLVHGRFAYSSCRLSSNILQNPRQSLAFSAGTRQDNEAPPSDSNNEEQLVKVGSEDYYKGFFSRSMNEEPTERVTGDNILGPTFKFVGGGVVIIVALFLGFMVSNGLI